MTYDAESMDDVTALGYMTAHDPLDGEALRLARFIVARGWRDTWARFLGGGDAPIVGLDGTLTVRGRGAADVEYAFERLLRACEDEGLAVDREAGQVVGWGLVDGERVADMASASTFKRKYHDLLREERRLRDGAPARDAKREHAVSVARKAARSRY